MYKVLIVEDEHYIRKGIRKYILDSGLDLEICSEAPNGMIGFEEAIKSKPDIIICDINMPAINGLDMISKIKMYLPEIVFIVLSGYREFDYAQRAIKLNVFDYILKPIDTNELKMALVRSVEYLNLNDNSKNSENKTDDEVYTKRNQLLGAVMSESREKVMDIFEEYFAFVCNDLDFDEQRNAEIGALIIDLQGISQRYDVHTNFISQPILKNEFDADSWKSVLCDMLTHLSESFRGQNANDSLICHRITEYISENYNKDIGSDEVISAVTHLSKNYVSSMFKRCCGMSIGECINKTRVINAQKLLSETKLSIENIAAKCGFVNPKYFYVIFRKIAGVSPGEYRKIHYKSNT